MALGSGFVDLIGKVAAGEDEPFDLFYRDLQPGLGRYGAFLLGEVDPDASSAVWLDLVHRLPTFDGTEGDLRAIAFGLVRRRCAADPRHRARGFVDHVARDALAHSVGNLTPFEAVATIARLLPSAQAEAVVLPVLSDLETELVAHVLATTTGAVRLAQHRALAALCDRVAPRMRRAWSGADDQPLGAVDLSDRTPESVFRGGLPPWQAHGQLAEVARLVSAARRAPLADEVEVPASVREAVRSLQPAEGPAAVAGGPARSRSTVSARLAAMLASVARSAEPVAAVRQAANRSAGDRWSGPVPGRACGAADGGDERGDGEVYAEPERAGPT
jgi:DNA-directed RNA polymerase specialized sigma24 family protein